MKESGRINETSFAPILAPLSGALIALILLRGASCHAQNAPVTSATIPEDAVQKITAALPNSAQVKALKPRKLLVFTLTRGFVHPSIPYGARALQMLGAKTGAFTTTESADITMLEPHNLHKFDAICMVSTTGVLFDNPALKKSLLDYVASGKGLIGIHAATDAFYDAWPQYGELIGGYFDGHPWHESVSVRVEDPKHPVNKAFDGKNSFDVVDEIYQIKTPYARDKQRVLLSLDMNKTAKKGTHADDDYPVSWIKSYGRGRVFYCSLGHREEIYWNPAVLRHYLAGIQFAMGDLKADVTPVPQPFGLVPETPLDKGDTVMGEYSGTMQWNGERVVKAEARVIAEGVGNYRAVLTALDEKTVRNPNSQVTELRSAEKDERIIFTSTDSSAIGTAIVQSGNFTGSITTGDGTLVTLALRKIMRHSPTEGMKPPRGATVLLPYSPGVAPDLIGLDERELDSDDGRQRSGERWQQHHAPRVRRYAITSRIYDAVHAGRARSGARQQRRLSAKSLRIASA